jgi:predicted O-methyltransferase YrrM
MKQPFEGDSLLQETMRQLIQVQGIDCVVETGTETGATAGAFAEMVANVYTCDVEDKVDRELPGNVHRHLGDSVEFLDMLLPELCRSHRVLFFLDAHLAPDFTRALDELDLIADQSCPDAVVVIHDFQVPGKDELGYDSYDGLGPMCVELIDSRLRKIFPAGSYSCQFNAVAEGAKRGVGIFYA